MSVAKHVTAARFTPLGGGFARFRHSRLDGWYLQYDEVLYVVDGELTLASDDETVTLRTGDVAVISKGSTVSYVAESADAFFVAYPGDWDSPVPQTSTAAPATETRAEEA